MEKNKNILTIVICVIIGLCVVGGVYYLISNDNGKHFSGKTGDTTVDNNKTEEENNAEEENNEEENNTEENEECDKYEFIFKSKKAISKDYSSLLSKLDFSNKTAFYCAGDICGDDEATVLEANSYDDEETTNVDFKVVIKDGKVVVSGEEINKTLDVKNPISVRAHFDVSDGEAVYILDKNNNLYYYNPHYEDSEMGNGLKKLYSNVKDFTVFEGNNYISNIEPSEGQNIVVGLHTTDGKFMIGHFDEKSFYNIKKVNFAVIDYDDNDGNYFLIRVSQSKDYTYEKNNGKEIVVKEVFTSNGKLYLYTTSGELLSTPLDENTSYCNTKYTKVKSSSVKSVTYNDSDKKVTVKFSDGTSETYTYSYKIDI